MTSFIDADEILARESAGCYTTLSLALNEAMDVSLEAQIDYIDTWGKMWEPVPVIGAGPVAMARGTITPTSERGTVR